MFLIDPQEIDVTGQRLANRRVDQADCRPQTKLIVLNLIVIFFYYDFNLDFSEMRKYSLHLIDAFDLAQLGDVVAYRDCHFIKENH